MKSMTIGTKIAVACSALVLLTMIMGTVAIVNISRMNGESHAIVEGALPGIRGIGLISEAAKEGKISMLETMLTSDPSEVTSGEATVSELSNKLQAELNSYEKTIQTARARELFSSVAPLNERISAAWAKMLPLIRTQKNKEALDIWKGELIPLSRQRARLLSDMSEDRKAAAEDAGAAAIGAGDSARFWSVLLTVLSFVSGTLLAYFIVRSINKALSKAVGELSEGAQQVASASGQVSGSSQSLAQGASEQAASLQETSASSEQMSSMTRKNAENSQQAARLMNVVSQRVAEANGTLADMTRSMDDIGASSGKISKIIRVIDEIAFQTNILALNAAVEAARAGEAGLGFAVVADEVRNLAQRSAQAAKDTADLIEESILKSGEGSTKLAQVAASIQAITEGAEKVKTLVDEVEASSKEQAQGIEQISRAVAQMDEVTQRNAANAEESASAGEELNAQSQSLMSVVGQLRDMVGNAPEGVSHQRRKTGSIRPTDIARRVAARAKQIAPKTPLHSGPAVAGKQPAAVLAPAARNAAEFPLDDSEFKEF